MALFHHLTRTAYLFNLCLPWYNVVLTLRVHSTVKYNQQSTVTAAVSCDGGISVLNHCLSWSKFVNTHLYHYRQWFNIHILSWAELRPTIASPVLTLGAICVPPTVNCLQ